MLQDMIYSEKILFRGVFFIGLSTKENENDFDIRTG